MHEKIASSPFLCWHQNVVEKIFKKSLSADMNSTSQIAGLAIYHMPYMYEIYVYIPFEWMGCQWYACGRHHPCLHGELHGQLWVCASRHFCQTWILEIWRRWWIQLEDLARALQLLMLKQWLLRLGFLKTSTVSTSCIRIPMTSQTWWERIWKEEWKKIDSWQQKNCWQLFVSIYCIKCWTMSKVASQNWANPFFFAN